MNGIYEIINNFNHVPFYITLNLLNEKLKIEFSKAFI